MIEVLKKALEALEISASAVDGYYIPVGKNMIPEVEEAITSLRQAIAKLESLEPVALPCCGYMDASAVKWNPLNGVVQCHNCGQNYTTSQRTEPPAWFPAVENILNEYGLQAIDFVADFKAAIKDAEQSQRTWVGLTDEEIEEGIKQSWVTEQAFQSAAWWAEAKLKEKNT
jgi:hypothetical protein